jgi:PiT family inorganic phosphate transporter
MPVILAILATAWANGANDNFKGVATLYGSGALRYRTALAWATLATLAGSLAALGFGAALARRFSGRGLVPEALAADPSFLVAVGGGAALTVLLATRLGMPVSTTHALVGGLAGAGIAAGMGVNLAALGLLFVGPLLLSPLLSIGLTLVLHPALEAGRRAAGVRGRTCVCVGAGAARPPAVALPGALPPAAASVTLAPAGITVTVDDEAVCRRHSERWLLGFSARQAVDALHLLSSGAVSFARGLNDAPKIAALLLAAAPLAAGPAYLTVAATVAAGGLFGARRVARTISHRITPMETGPALSANLATAFLVLAASGLGLPVSTTHVSIGAIFGIGIAGRRARRAVVLEILLAWMVTLPLAACLAALILAAGAS